MDCDDLDSSGDHEMKYDTGQSTDSPSLSDATSQTIGHMNENIIGKPLESTQLILSNGQQVWLPPGQYKYKMASVNGKRGLLLHNICHLSQNRKRKQLFVPIECNDAPTSDIDRTVSEVNTSESDIPRNKETAAARDYESVRSQPRQLYERICLPRSLIANEKEILQRIKQPVPLECYKNQVVWDTTTSNTVQQETSTYSSASRVLRNMTSSITTDKLNNVVLPYITSTPIFNSARDLSHTQQYMATKKRKYVNTSHESSLRSVMSACNDSFSKLLDIPSIAQTLSTTKPATSRDESGIYGNIHLATNKKSDTCTTRAVCIAQKPSLNERETINTKQTAIHSTTAILPRSVYSVPKTPMVLATSRRHNIINTYVTSFGSDTKSVSPLTQLSTVGNTACSSISTDVSLVSNSTSGTVIYSVSQPMNPGFQRTSTVNAIRGAAPNRPLKVVLLNSSAPVTCHASSMVRHLLVPINSFNFLKGRSLVLREKVPVSTRPCIPFSCVRTPILSTAMTPSNQNLIHVNKVSKPYTPYTRDVRYYASVHGSSSTRVLDNLSYRAVNSSPRALNSVTTVTATSTINHVLCTEEHVRDRRATPIGENNPRIATLVQKQTTHNKYAIPLLSIKKEPVSIDDIQDQSYTSYSNSNMFSLVHNTVTTNSMTSAIMSPKSDDSILNAPHSSNVSSNGCSHLTKSLAIRTNGTISTQTSPNTNIHDSDRSELGIKIESVFSLSNERRNPRWVGRPYRQEHKNIKYSGDSEYDIECDHMSFLPPPKYGCQKKTNLFVVLERSDIYAEHINLRQLRRLKKRRKCDVLCRTSALRLLCHKNDLYPIPILSKDTSKRTIMSRHTSYQELSSSACLKMPKLEPLDIDCADNNSCDGFRKMPKLEPSVPAYDVVFDVFTNRRIEGDHDSTEINSMKTLNDGLESTTGKREYTKPDNYTKPKKNTKSNKYTKSKIYIKANRYTKSNKPDNKVVTKKQVDITKMCSVGETLNITLNEKFSNLSQTEKKFFIMNLGGSKLLIPAKQIVHKPRCYVIGKEHDDMKSISKETFYYILCYHTTEVQTANTDKSAIRMLTLKDVSRMFYKSNSIVSGIDCISIPKSPKIVKQALTTVADSVRTANIHNYNKPLAAVPFLVKDLKNRALSIDSMIKLNHGTNEFQNETILEATVCNDAKEDGYGVRHSVCIKKELVHESEDTYIQSNSSPEDINMEYKTDTNDLALGSTNIVLGHKLSKTKTKATNSAGPLSRDDTSVGTSLSASHHNDRQRLVAWNNTNKSDSDTESGDDVSHVSDNSVSVLRRLLEEQEDEIRALRLLRQRSEVNLDEIDFL